jgi:hypothetical protein
LEGWRYAKIRRGDIGRRNGAAGTVEVKRFGGSSTIQILYDINNHVFLRRKVGEEAWNAWTQV